jgi:5-formyltetrahydrofolate cyclo-ligase
MAARRKNHGEAEKGPKDDAIRQTLLSLPELKRAGTVLFYVSIGGEVRTEEAISETLRMGKKVLVPFANANDRTLKISEIHDLDELSPGAFGIPEPKHPKEFPLNEIDLVVIPGIAFDRSGNRVGYGMGFYDRFLNNLKKNVPLVAVAYDFQIVDSVPRDANDIRVHKIVTEKEVIECDK